MTQTQNYGIHWFRRDLRIAGNPALLWNWQKHEGRVLGLFTFDKKFLAREDFSENRFAFFLETLRDLRSQLLSCGGDLLFLDSGPEEAFTQLFEKLKHVKIPLPQTVSFNRDYEPFAIGRDTKIEKLLEQDYQTHLHTERDHLLIEPHEIIKDGQKPFYQVYTPFQRAWMKSFNKELVQNRVQLQARGFQFLKALKSNKIDSHLFQLTWKELFRSKVHITDVFERYQKPALGKISISLPKAGALHAYEKIQNFYKRGLQTYDHDREIPGISGTSQISIFLKNGSITVPQIIAACNLSTGKYLNELIWQEFYYHILAHRPDVETEPFQEKYKRLKWQNKESYFKAWQEGRTGYPIVDAGMRQLKETGWMHNRVRMVVASFLTKDLLIDYRWGEKHFMKLLLDGDLAPNNGGWQWAASTGCDPQPYFRVFNPVLQSGRFDPKGDYIRRWVPELRDLDSKEIHEPWKSPKKTTYPKPIVDHAEQKDKAIALFKDLK